MHEQTYLVEFWAIHLWQTERLRQIQSGPECVRRRRLRYAEDITDAAIAARFTTMGGGNKWSFFNTSNCYLPSKHQAPTLCAVNLLSFHFALQSLFVRKTSKSELFQRNPILAKIRLTDSNHLKCLQFLNTIIWPNICKLMQSAAHVFLEWGRSAQILKNIIGPHERETYLSDFARPPKSRHVSGKHVWAVSNSSPISQIGEKLDRNS